MNRILIVDDNPKNIQLIANILKDYDFEVEYGQDGEEAIEIAKSQKFDLILMDVMMPHKDGFEACIDVKKTALNADTPLIFITAKTEEEHITKGFKVGGVDYVTKPFNAAELLSRIETHITLKKSKDKLRELNITLEDNLKETHKNLEITQQKLKEATANMANLDSAKSEFLQIISHEIRTPLNGIIGLLSVFEEMMNNREEQEFFDLFYTSCKRLEKFSLLALDISLLKTKGKEVLNYQPTNITEIIKTCITLAQNQITEKDLQLITSCNSTCVEADANLMAKSFSIILKNVIEHSSQSGKVNINCKDNESSCIIRFQDEGPGLPETVLNDKLSSFSTGKHVDENPGLELYFCKLVAEAHGGTISLKNNSLGAEIVLNIPKKKYSNQLFKAL